MFLSILLDLFESIFADMKIITNDKLLSSIYGGLIIGIGNGIILKNNASTGGTRSEERRVGKECS